MLGRFGVWEVLLIVILVVILFGHNKIPGMMKNVADGLKVFKKELKTEEKTAPVEKPLTKKAPAKRKPIARKKPAKKVVKK